jgi:hypothetical protein
VEQIVAEIVVHLADLERALAALQVEEARLQMGQQGVERLELLIQPGGQQTGAQGRQVVGVPPAVHVRLAQAQRTVREHAGVEAFVVDMQIGGAAAVEADIGQFEQRAGALFKSILTHAFLRGSLGVVAHATVKMSVPCWLA